METKHTPGPWEESVLSDGTEWTVIGPNEDMLADLSQCDNAEANARLIAAAPDMFAALRQWAVAERMGDAHITQSARASRDAAIAKAQG